ncbi:V-set and transmembrane domain-containing protein 5 isoform X1 [Phoca vitulina]|uniref:V-set and transmembrane domain-containing protein 5 isoform X1 n=1 Tax=Phoca vitulina TaxID=9720 RepID=UPI0013960E25|nr:V-set and transmembrane domain-containing protein 5 isoform X1 [Phoca vitulina]
MLGRLNEAIEGGVRTFKQKVIQISSFLISKGDLIYSVLIWKRAAVRRPSFLHYHRDLRTPIYFIPCQGVSLYIPQSTINATVEEDILLSVEYSCHGVPTIEWKYTSNWGAQKIVEWQPGTQANISQSHKDRLCTFDNGSIQLFSVSVRDSGYYVITVTERLGRSQFGTIVLHVSEILYEDLHFVAVFLAFLAAVATLLISLMWVCNKCAYKFQRKRRHKLKESTTEEMELQDVEC